MTEKEIQEAVKEIEAFYGYSLNELLQLLMQEPIVRHFKGNYYRVVGLAQTSENKNMTVVYTALNKTDSFMWTGDLLDFLSPVPEESADLNVTGQKRRFYFVNDVGLQLDLVSTETLLKELSERNTGIIRISEPSVVEKSYLVARVEENYGEKYIHSVLNHFPTLEEAENFLVKHTRQGDISVNTEIVTRISYLNG